MANKPRMYEMSSLAPSKFDLIIPNVMYALKSVHAARNVEDGTTDYVSQANGKLDITEQNNQNEIGMAELLARQEEILKQLAQLKQQMLSIKTELKLEKAPSKSCSNTAITTNTEKNLQDVVINANPNTPPYGLAIAQVLLQDCFSLTVTSHLHSTVSQLPENAKLLTDKLTSFKPRPNVPKLNVKLIWKNIETNLELLVSHLPICGEANALRYLARLGSSQLNYTNFEVDSLLDVCYLIGESKNKTARAKHIQVLNKSLGKSQFLGDNKMGVADVAAYSILKQTAQPAEINIAMSKWMKRCEDATKLTWL